LKNAAYYTSVLALVIVLLGVIGLVSMSIHKRNKEIGIRKVLGASSQVIIKLFLNEFFTLVLIACVIAIPIAYFIMENWLNNYAYHINISLNPFIFSVGILIAITCFLIGGLTWKTANVNPVKSMKNE
jgi:ABC-type antimicrobial peptide transport system permease subunit